MSWTCCTCELVSRARIKPTLCHHCGALDTFLRTAAAADASSFQRADTLVSSKPTPRYTTNERELDALLGGGLPAGSTILLWGRGGSGKSRCALRWSTRNALTACVSVEMTEELCTTSCASAGGRLDRLLITRAVDAEPPRSARFVIYDSISKARDQDAVLDRLEQWAKRTGGVAIAICHATKAGDYRGASTLQHWPDVEIQVSATKKHPGHARVRINKSRFCALGSALVPIVGTSLRVV